MDIRRRLPHKIRQWSTRSLILMAVGILVITAAGGRVVWAALGLGGGGSPIAANSVNLQRGLVGQWDFNGNMNDLTPNGGNGTNVNGATLTTDRKGRVDSAYSFNGTNQQITVPDSPAVSPTTGMTVQAWFKGSVQNTSYAGSGIAGIVSKDVGLGIDNPPYVIQVSNGTLALITVSSDNTFRSVGTSGLLDNTWYHAVGTYDGTNACLYLNGVLKQCTPQAPLADTSGLLRIGQQKNAAARYFQGTIDDVRIYNRAVNQTEVTALYEAYDSGLKSSSAEKDLVGHWEFNGSSKDSTPYSNNPTITGAIPTTDRKGRANSAYSFNGVDQYMTMPASNDLNASVFTYSAWIKTSVAATQTIIGWSSNGAPQFRLLTSSGNNLLSLTKQGQVSMAILGSVPLNTWSHVAITYDSSGVIRMYLNGVQVGTSTSAQTFTFSNMRIGGAAGQFFNGSIDDVRVYKRVLSQGELLTQYQSYDSQINLGGGSGSINLASGLVGHWAMNGNSNDQTPYSFNGVINGAVALTNDRKNRANKAYAFTDSSTYIRAPNRGATMPGESATISFWLKPNSWSGGSGSNGNVALIAARTVSDSYGFMIFKSNTNELAFDWGSTLTGNRWQSGYLPPTGQWTHIAFTRDNSSRRLYVNGVQAGWTGQAGNSSLVAQSVDLIIGRENPGSGTASGYGYNGALDDVRIYNRTLTASEIKALADLYY